MCSFVPCTVFQSIADDDSISESIREGARGQINAITSTLAASAEAEDAESTVKTRYDVIPTGFSDFSSKIWGMAAKNFEEVNYKTGEVLGSSYTPLPGVLYRTSQDPSYQNDADVDTCMEGLRTTYNFYKEVFGRESIDGKGLQIEASIHYSIRYANAIWEPTSQQMILGDGDGNSRFGRHAGLFKPRSLVSSLDVIAHELTHGVTQHTAKFVYENQSGALNESVSDVFGSMVLQWKNNQTVKEASWLLGDGIIYSGSESLSQARKGATSLRSMKDPSAKTNLDPQPDSMDSPLFYRGPVKWDKGGVHRNSGVPNHAFYKIAMELGSHSWERAGRIWYATLTDPRMHPNTTFREFADVTILQAKLLFAEDPRVADVVEQAWKAVKVLRPTACSRDN